MIITSKDILGIVLFIIIPFAFSGIYLPKWAFTLAAGRKIGSSLSGLLGCFVLLLSPIIMFVVMYVGLFFPVAPLVDSSLEHYRFSAYTLPVFIGSFMGSLTLLELFRRFRLKKSTNIEIGRNEIKLTLDWFIGISIINFFGYRLLSVLLEKETADFRLIAWAVCYLAIVVFIVILITKKTYLTNQGLSKFISTIKWGDISGYRWGKSEGEQIELGFHPKYGAETILIVPLSQIVLIDNFIRTQGHAHLKLPHGRPLVEGGGG